MAVVLYVDAKRERESNEKRPSVISQSAVDTEWGQTVLEATTVLEIQKYGDGPQRKHNAERSI
jgi:hypothetical protein